jgi:phage shock protein PspC (stress-responsive transcriptional regulator)
MKEGTMEMSRRIYPYSLASKDAKIAGVCSTLGARFGIDPTFIRIAWVAVPLLTPVSFTTAIIAYAIVGVILAIQKKRAMTGERRLSDFDRMDLTSQRKPTVKAMRTELDETDRRLMAIDHHINTQNDDLAREIEALREEEK